MLLMSVGLLLWVLVHYIPSLAPSLKVQLQGRFGEGGYKAGFSVAVVLGLVLIVLGWRSTTPTFLYMLPPGVKHGSMLLVLVGFLLFGMKAYPSRVKRVIRHPQLSGVLCWAVAHLLMNGDTRSVLLFGTMALWSVVQMWLINRREGPWQKPEAGSWFREARGALISTVLFVVVAGFLHPYIAGMPVFH